MVDFQKFKVIISVRNANALNKKASTVVKSKNRKTKKYLGIFGRSKKPLL